MNSEWQDWIQRLAASDSKLDLVLFGYTRCQTDYHIAKRSLPEHLFYLVQEHDIHATFADHERIIEAGQLMWLPPGVEHSFRPAQTGTKILVYHHRFICAAGCPQHVPVILPANAHQRERFSALHDGSSLLDPNWLIRYRASLVLTFCEIAASQLCSTQHDGTVFNLTQRQQIMNAIHRNPWLDPESLAKHLDYHPAYFTRLFKRSYDLPPRTWILQQRMQHAATLLLESVATINEISANIGYADPFIFSRQFKQIHGLSPRAWRQRHAAPPKQL